MAEFSVEITPPALKELEQLPNFVLKRVLTKHAYGIVGMDIVRGVVALIRQKVDPLKNEKPAVPMLVLSNFAPTRRFAPLQLPY